MNPWLKLAGKFAVVIAWAVVWFYLVHGVISAPSRSLVGWFYCGGVLAWLLVLRVIFHRLFSE